MAKRPPSQQAGPAEIIAGMNLGYNGYSDPTTTKPQMWSAAVNVFSGAFSFIQRCRFANVYTQSPTTGLPYTTLKYFAIPGTGAYLLADQNGLLYSYDTSAAYTQTQRLNPYVDPSGAGSTQLNGPWMRETLQSIVYEMNGQVKQAGRGANAAIIEGWGLDAPDSTPAVTIAAGNSVALTNIQRMNNVVTATAAALPVGPFTSPALLNIVGVNDPTFNGSFSMIISGGGPFTFTWTQLGQNTALIAGSGNVTSEETKAVGRSYAWAWENANKNHIGAPSPATQYVQYTNQNAILGFSQPGTITVDAFGGVTGVGTAFSSAWIGRSILGSVKVHGRILTVTSPTTMTSVPVTFGPPGETFQIYDPQATHIRIYATADGGATYFRIGRNAFTVAPGQFTTPNSLTFFDGANAEPPNFPFTTEVAQANNVPPPIGSFVNEYQGRLLVYAIPGVPGSFFYSNVETTTLGLQQESFAPLNQVTLPIQNAQVNGMIELPGDLIIWSDKQDMFRLTGLLTDNSVSATATQQGASIARLPYNIGIANPFATDITPLGAFWLSSNNEIWLFTDRYAPRNIGRPVQDILTTITPAGLKLARIKYYHANNRNWLTVAVAANGASFNNTVLVLDLDLLASNGSPSYFTFDMATNSPSWFVFQPGTSIMSVWTPRCDSLEVVYEAGGLVRLMVGQVDLIQDIDFTSGAGTEISIPNGTVTTHPWGNDSAFLLKTPAWIRFNTNRNPSLLASDGWSFAVSGIDDDFYTFQAPLTLALTPGVNDSSSLGGNPDFFGGLAFRHSPELYKIGGVNFVMGRRMEFTVNFPTGTGVNYQLRAIQVGFGAEPPS